MSSDTGPLSSWSSAEQAVAAALTVTVQDKATPSRLRGTRWQIVNVLNLETFHFLESREFLSVRTQPQ